MEKNIFIAAIISGILFGSCKNSQNNDLSSENFHVITTQRTDTFVYSDYVAEIHARQNVEIRARVSGYLEKIHVDEGAKVKEGQLLFSINNREYLEELAKARAAYKSSVADVDAAELELKNVTQLAEKKIVSSTEVAFAKNKLEAQIAKRDEAQAHEAYIQIKLSNTEIRAPFNGIINRIPHKTGSLIDEGTLLTNISDHEDVYAYFDVSEKEYLRFARHLISDSSESKAVSLMLADGSEHPYKGRIETVEGMIDPQTGNIAFRARFPNPNKILLHGASGRVRLRKKFPDAIIVPQKSTFEIQDKLYVYVIDQHNVIHTRNIEQIGRLPHLYIVSKGLKEGERIIYEGTQNVKDGMKITPLQKNVNHIIRDLASK